MVIVMRLKKTKLALCTLLLFSTVFATVAQAQSAGGEGGGNSQTPIQVIAQIVLTAIALRVLNFFNLP